VTSGKRRYEGGGQQKGGKSGGHVKVIVLGQSYILVVQVRVRQAKNHPASHRYDVSHSSCKKVTYLIDIE
jgi:hypothetical protein